MLFYRCQGRHRYGGLQICVDVNYIQCEVDKPVLVFLASADLLRLCCSGSGAVRPERSPGLVQTEINQQSKKKME